jgi:diguanylate cyclase (GGDEF)-like protein
MADPRISQRPEAGGRRPRAGLAGALALALGIASAGGTGLALWTGWSGGLAAAEAELHRIAAAAAMDAARAVAAADAAAAALQARLAEAGPATPEELRRLAPPPPPLILDAEGAPLSGTMPLDASLDAARAALRDGAGPAFGPALRAAETGTWLLPVLRGLAAPDGAPLGAVLALADLSPLLALHGELAAQSGGGLALRDGEEAEPPPGWLARLAPPVLAAELPVPGTPLRLRAEAATWVVLAAWREQAVLLGGSAALGLLGLLLALRLAARRRRRAQEAEAARLAAREEAVALARAAAEQTERYRRDLAVHGSGLQATLGSMSQGLMTFDHTARLVLANTRCAELVGLPLEALRPGTPFAALATAAAAAEAEGAARLLDRLMPLVVRREPAAITHELDARRAVLAVHRPLPDGGWLLTFDDASAARAAEQRLREAALRDPLTGLPNLGFLEAELAAVLPPAAAGGGQAALLHLNLDRFRGVNEALGKRAGDALLRAVATRLRRLVRTGRGGDLVARLGADEFVVLTAPAASPRADAGAEAAGIAERLVAELGRPYEVEGYRVVVTVSIGIALFPESGRGGEELLTRAALAMRAAKGMGRGGYAFYSPDMAEAAHWRRLVELDLRLALTEGAGRAFEMRYLPLVDLATRRVAALEAILCWQHPVHGLVGPESLLPIAAELGLAAPLGRLALRRAAAEVAPYAASLRLCLGLSLAQLLDPGLVERIAATLAETGLPASRLEVAVKEVELLGAPPLALDTLLRLRAGGVRAVLDELGAGTASPAALRAAPFDRARVSPGLVRELGGRSHGLGIVQAVAALCARQGIPIAAAGVETEEQLQLLAAERCLQAGGPLFGPALAARDLPGLFGGPGDVRVAEPRRLAAPEEAAEDGDADPGEAARPPPQPCPAHAGEEAGREDAPSPA